MLRKKIIGLLLLATGWTACTQNFDEINTDPNRLEKIAPSAHKIGASSAIEALHRQVVSGLNEAQLMRDFVADGGSLIGLVKKHCEIWAGD